MRTFAAAWLLVVLALIGCASGTAFRKVDAIPADKALIYIYRPGVQGAAKAPAIVINKLSPIPLQARGYYPYLSDPGEVTISAILTGKKSITMNVRAGETYYVKAGTVVMAFGIPYIELVPAKVALAEIPACKRLPDVAGVDSLPTRQ